ncbi:hypothetical protein GLI01_21120 [Gluconacetobacter liquefaciens]|uniref:Uncharacterized protein n=1 Tax=Gluconacetobacter liquefaciens TaxID=89584 RepID=A0A7W4JIP9_GLULI|nr:hypothetical protein [Gluconacetobacter liquefaciens]MBB2185500.1 hypothetical protein [Gluconacetobacter liquefaciens]GEB38077.1 hypothetical protein GLI01_21120 [Gluconacetobacter liquefaciens]
MTKPDFTYQHSEYGLSKLRGNEVQEDFHRDEHYISLEITDFKTIHRLSEGQVEVIEITGNSIFTSKVFVLDGSSLSSDCILTIRLICSGDKENKNKETRGNVNGKNISIDFELPYSPWYNTLFCLPDKTEKITIKAKSQLYYSHRENFSIIIRNDNFKTISVTEVEIHR